ncbi:MAG: EcsC family protein [Terriglobia bacterium]
MRAYPRNRANINGFNGDEVFGKHKANERTGVAVYILFARAGIEDNMGPRGSSWIRRRAEQAMKIGLLRAYRGVGVNPDRYLKHLRRAYGLHVTSFREMNTVPLPVVDYLADKTIRASMKMAMLEGAGAGLGGMLSILPDIGFLGGITWRMIQKLSLLHGFEYASEDDMADLWLAAASAAGVDMGKDLVRKQVIERFVPRLIERIAVRAGGEIAENGLCRLVPVLGSAMGGTLNYYFVRGWGRRAQRHFRERHILLRSSLLPPPCWEVTAGATHSPQLALPPARGTPTPRLTKRFRIRVSG